MKTMTWPERGLALVALLPGLLFILMGLRWLFDPAGIAPTLGLTVETGLGLSSQIGDLAGFFLVAGMSIVIAVTTRTRHWFYPPLMLLLIAALGRLVAWAMHGAEFATQQIGFELVVAIVLLVASRILPNHE